MELFQAFLTDSCYTSFAEVSKKLSQEVEQQKLLRQLLKYYMSERRHLLRCVKHLFGCWQDPIHPYRVRGGLVDGSVDEISDEMLMVGSCKCL